MPRTVRRKKLPVLEPINNKRIKDSSFRGEVFHERQGNVYYNINLLERTKKPSEIFNAITELGLIRKALETEKELHSKTHLTELELKDYDQLISDIDGVVKKVRVPKPLIKPTKKTSEKYDFNNEIFWLKHNAENPPDKKRAREILKNMFFVAEPIPENVNEELLVEALENDYLYSWNHTNKSFIERHDFPIKEIILPSQLKQNYVNMGVPKKMINEVMSKHSDLVSGMIQEAVFKEMFNHAKELNKEIKGLNGWEKTKKLKEFKASKDFCDQLHEMGLPKYHVTKVIGRLKKELKERNWVFKENLQ